MGDLERTRPAGDFSVQPWRKGERGAGKCMSYGSRDDRIPELASFKRDVMQSHARGLEGCPILCVQRPQVYSTSEWDFLVSRSIFSSVETSCYPLDAQGLHHIPLELFGVDFLVHLPSDTVSSIA